MRAIVNREALVTAHAIAARGVATASRATPQVLTDIRYTAAAGELILSAMDGTTSVATRVAAMVEEDGSTAVRPSPLGEAFGSLDCASVLLRAGDEKHSLVVVGGRSVSTVRGQDPVDYPPIPTLPDAVAGTAPARVFAEIARQCVIAAAHDGAATILNGVSMQTEGDTLTLAAADRFRLSVRTGRLVSARKAGPLKVIVPATALAEFVKVLPPGDVTVSFGLTESGRIIVFRAGPTEYSTRLIEGEYINYRPLIPTSCASRAIMPATELRRALRTVQLFARESGNFMSLTTVPGEGDGLGSLVLGAEAADSGAGSSPVDAVVEGASITLCCNAGYLAGFLDVVHAAHVAIELESPVKPAVLRPIDDSDLTYIVMPMNRPPAPTSRPAPPAEALSTSPATPDITKARAPKKSA